jgi:two-component system sensor histidine kinase KdpD
MSRGRLRIYLGAAPGVGKTYAMLDEGNRRRARGTDVVIGYVETHRRANTEGKLGELPVVPRQKVMYRGAELEEMDVDAVLARHPDVALVDELAHTNAPGSRNPKRWQDVEELLRAGIDVITTVNIQHLESVNDVVERITGVKQQETVPDAAVRAADQVELVDMDPEALRRRMAHGNIYPPEKVDAALGNYFRSGNLAALRELALLWVADKVDDALQSYLEDHGIEGSWETRERVVVAVTGAPSGEHLIRRAARMAQRAKGDLVGVHISPSDGLVTQAHPLLEAHQQLLADLGGEYHEVVGADVAQALVQFARVEHATQLVMGATDRSRLEQLTRGSVINTVIRLSGDIDVHVISQPAEVDTRSPSLTLPRRNSQLTPRRRLVSWLLVLLGIPLLTLVLIPLSGSLNLTSSALLYLLLVTVIAVVGGPWPSMVAAIVSSLVVNWFFAPPVHTFTIEERDNFLALVIFVAVAGLVSMVVSQSTRRSVDVARARTEAEALARIAGGLMGEDDPLLDMVSHVRSTFGFDGVSVLRREEAAGAGGSGDSWGIIEATGSQIPLDPRDGESMPLSEGAVLVMKGGVLTADDRRVLQVFAAQLDSALERRRLRSQAAEASAMAEADQLRTAILRAVSHDLRTPLASIKASVTSLLQDDVLWSEEDRSEFLATIDEETDRLNDLVGNLLDMSRIETGALDVSMRAVGLDEVVARSLASISGPTDRVEVAVSESLPRVMADPALLERAVANLVSNALFFSPTDRPVRVEAGEFGPRVDLRIVDRGPGMPPEHRGQMFEPFQRFGDTGVSDTPGTGVGLGLAVAKGFVEAVDGHLVIEDTPGGGLTAIIELVACPSAVADGELSDEIATRARPQGPIAGAVPERTVTPPESPAGDDVGLPSEPRGAST